MVTNEKLYTVDAFEAFQDNYPDRRFELIDGRIVEDVTNEEHGAIAINIGFQLKAWKKTNKVNGYYSVESSVRLPDDDKNYRKPDVAFRLTDDATVSKASTLDTMPDFVVEIKSTGNTFKALREKARYYLANGARLVWLVYPDKKLVEVYFEDGSLDIMQVGDTLSGGEVLPKFEMTVSEVFEV